MDSKIIKGDQILLRSITESDTPLIIKWRNKQTVRDNFIWREELTEAHHLSWISQQIQTGLAKQFVIEVLDGAYSIGSVYLKNIDHVRNCAEYGIFIGEDRAIGRGYGTEAARLILDYAFTQLDLQSVFLRVWSHNAAAIKSYQKAGFCLTVSIAGEKPATDGVIFMEIKKQRDRRANEK